MAASCQTVIFAAILGVTFSFENTRIVQTTEGKIEGSLSENGLNYEYLGIRYAVPAKFKVSSLFFLSY